jgi:hypothetical protein
MISAAVLQAEGQVAEGSVQLNLASITKLLGEMQGSLSLVQGLLEMNNGQMTADTKTLQNLMQSHSQALATLVADLPKPGAALARVLA